MVTLLESYFEDHGNVVVVVLYLHISDDVFILLYLDYLEILPLDPNKLQ